jgi:hypothetical protein
LIKRQWQESCIKGQEGVKAWFSRYFSKVSEDCGELGIDAFLVDFIKFGGSTTLGDAQRLGSSNSQCRFVDEHYEQDATVHSRYFRIVEYCSSSSSDRI